MPRRVADDVHKRAIELYRQQKSPKEIVALLRDDPVVRKSGDGPPVQRTVQRWIQAYDKERQAQRALDPLDYWRLEDGGAALVLPVVAAVAETRDGGLDAPSIGRDIAEWIRRIGAEFPDMPPLEQYFVAFEYLMASAEEARRGRGHERPGLYVAPGRWAADAYLAFVPWRDRGQRYVAAIAERALGRVRPLRTPSTYELLDEALPGLGLEPIEWMDDLPARSSRPLASAEEEAFERWEEERLQEYQRKPVHEDQGG